MKIKLDENLGNRGAAQLRAAGHDVATVAEQQMCSTPDQSLIEACRDEGRCLVTLDREFGDLISFDPSDYSGIAVLRLPPKPTAAMLSMAVETLIVGLARESIQARLWTVQIGRIRTHDPDDQDL